MAEVALTRIVHGNEDGSRTVIEENDEVKDLPKEVVQDLRDQGLVGEPVQTPAQRDDELASLRDENAELEGQLAELKAQLAAAQNNSKSGSTK